ncbi:MAG: PBP1A family penicillin-binding protein [Parcubacteria group bacterium]|nr:PBP1A family penicillin-binding protein [Parcubacteria group bacterium]
MKKKKKILHSFLLWGLFLLFVIISVGSITVLYISLDLPQVEHFSERPVPQTTKIYDRTGQVLLYDLYGDQKRTTISLKEVPLYVQRATLALEDKDFYNHSAFSIKGIARSLLVNVRGGEALQGGSTITQQLVKNALLDPQKTISRKIKELILAYKLEQQYSKDQILELYLNEIPYGGNAYGIEVASQTYFDKSTKDLTLAEAATLAALPKAPTYYSPYGSNTKKLFERERYGLKTMKDLGWITDEEYNNAIAEKITFVPQKVAIRAPHFVMMVINYLNTQYGEDFVRNAGLKVTTTLDWPTQQIAEDVVKKGAERNTELYKGTNAALLSEDPKTGQIISLVGSRDYFDTAHEGNFDVTTQGLRQPGSSFKPIAYIAAFKKGYSPQTVLFDLKTEFDTTNDPNNSYQPENYDHIYGGPVTLKRALANSLNVPAVKVLYLAGMQNVIDTAKSFGITTLGDYRRYGLSLVLGGGEVHLIEMVHAYSVFSQEGNQHKQQFILKVESKEEKTLEEYQDEQHQVIEPVYTQEINDILSDDDARSRLFTYHGPLYFDGYDVAAKTGTTNDYRDAWVIGYTPNIVTGIWAGNNDNTPMQKNAGSILAAVPILHDFYTQVLPTRPKEFFTKPTPVYSNKPMLNGEYITEISSPDGSMHNEVHDILYYVDRNNPQGAEPLNPNSDAQFKNWEEPVFAWVAQNNIQIKKTKTSPIISPLPPSSLFDAIQKPPVIISLPITLEITNPENGGYIYLPFDGDVSFNQTPQNVKIFFNDTLVQDNTSPHITEHFTISRGELYMQNSLRIEATNASGKTTSKEIILFGKN